MIQAGSGAELLGSLGRGQHHRHGAVGDGGQVVPTQGLADVVLGEQGVDVPVALHLCELVADGAAPGPERDLGHRPFVGDACRNDGPGLQGGEGDRVHAEGGEVVRVHLHRVDEGGIPGGRASRSGHDGDLDVALLQPQPRLVEGPGTVHLDVGVALGRPGTDGIDVLDEGEGLPGDVVTGALAGEIDVRPGQSEAVRARR